MKLETKARTLSKIKIKNAKIPKLIFFNVKKFKENQYKCLSEIKKKFDSDIIIRSSTIYEDNEDWSFAGSFKSIPNVCSKNTEKIKKY